MDWSADKLTHLATGYWQSATLIAAVQLGVFDHLDQSTTSDDLANQCDCSPRLLPSLLDALVAVQLLEKVDNRYLISPSAFPYLSRSSDSCLLNALQYNADLYQKWASLASVIREGKSSQQSPAQLGRDPAMTRRFVMGMESKARAFLPAVAPYISLNGQRTLLDVGSGPGTLSRYLAEQKPNLRITLLDLPEVLEIARECWKESPALSRVDFVAADYRAEILPQPFEAILYSGALHQENRENAEQLFSQFHRSLSPGGKLSIVDLMLDDDRTQPAFSALFQINMLLIQPGSRVFSRREVDEMLLNVGFEVIDQPQPESSPYRVVLAKKPEER